MDLGAYEPASDVSAHAKVVLDVCDVNAALPGDGEPDYEAARSAYAEGGNSPSGDGVRTLQGFATGELDEPLWNLYTERFGPTWLDVFVTAALDGTGPFEGEADGVRRQGIQKGVQNQILVAWAFHEIDAAREKVEAGETDAASGAPHNVDEVWAFYHGADPSCGAVATASKRGADFGTGEATNERALAAVETMRDAALAGDLATFDEGYDEFVAAVATVYAQATIKYAVVMGEDLAAGDDETARVHQAEGWAFYRVIEPLVADADPEAADTIADILSLDSEPQEGAGDTVRQALESVYDDLGITAEDVGTYEG